MSAQQTQELLRVLSDAKIEHVVVGGVAAIAWGASEFTRDFDIVIPWTAKHIAALLTALAPHSPKHATRPDLGVVRDSADELVTHQMLLLDTALGRIDVHSRCEPIGDHARLHAHAASMQLDDGAHLVIALNDLITVKEHLGRPKDLLVAAQLKAIRARLRHG